MMQRLGLLLLGPLLLLLLLPLLLPRSGWVVEAGEPEMAASALGADGPSAVGLNKKQLPGRKPMVHDGQFWIDLKAQEEAYFEAHPEMRGRKPYPPHSESWKDPKTTMFIGIASFRDPRCGRTLKNIYTKSAHPERIYTGVVQQHHAQEDPDCIATYCKMMKELGVTDPENPGKCPYVDQVRIIRVSFRESKGPTTGRAMQGQLLKDEEFCMQMDSHMDFEPNFDVQLMEEWALTENEYAILSTYVHDIESLGQHWVQVPHNCRIEWSAGGMIKNMRAKNAYYIDRPLRAPLWAAGFSFGRCHYMRLVPYDPFLPQLWDSEEASMALRLMSRGYDIYSPHRSIVTHDYHTLNRKDWGFKPGDAKTSRLRIQTLLGMPDGDKTTEGVASLGRYGLGNKRSLDQLIDLTGIDLRNQRVVADRCGYLPWIPFEEDPDPEVEDSSVWGPAPYRVHRGARHVPVALAEG